MAESLSFEKYDALLFDLDGTLAHSMDLHNHAWVTTLARHGCPINATILFEYAGVPNAKTLVLFNERFGWKLDPIQIAEEKEALFMQSVNQVLPIEPVVKIARDYFGRKPMAIVSGGSRFLVNRIVEILQLGELFPIRICAEDVTLPKPHPDPFLKGAELLKVPATKCIVFEDGDAGIQSAHAAGMDVIRVDPQFKLTPVDRRV